MGARNSDRGWTKIGNNSGGRTQRFTSKIIIKFKINFVRQIRNARSNGNATFHGLQFWQIFGPLVQSEAAWTTNASHFPCLSNFLKSEFNTIFRSIGSANRLKANSSGRDMAKMCESLIGLCVVWKRMEALEWSDFIIFNAKIIVK